MLQGTISLLARDENVAMVGGWESTGLGTPLPERRAKSPTPPLEKAPSPS